MFNSRQRLHDDIEIIFSTVSDGSMAAGGGQPANPDHQRNADRFLQKYNFPLERYRVLVRYGDQQSYRDIERVDKSTPPGDVVSDAVYTTLAEVVITLPVADCVATVVYDPVSQLLAVLHLGRHSSVAGLIEDFIIEVTDNVGSDPRDWHIWMSPSLRQGNDRLDYFQSPDITEWQDYMRAGDDNKIHIDTVGHNVARFVRAGVATENITVSPIDTYGDQRFYSQRAYVEQGNLHKQGRMMVAVRRL